MRDLPVSERPLLVHLRDSQSSEDDDGDETVFDLRKTVRKPLRTSGKGKGSKVYALEDEDDVDKALTAEYSVAGNSTLHSD